jgi:uncharacterized protein YecE (DUF72 family)
MDKVTQYRHILRQVVCSLADFINCHSHEPRSQTHAVVDDEHGHYLLVKSGWARRRRVRGTTVYIRLHDEKVWIEEDMTEEGISRKLVSAGIPEDDIVMAFQSPEPGLSSEVMASTS